METQTQLYQIERPFIAYSLCFDDVMRTYLQREDIPYSEAFGFCWEFEYDCEKTDMSEAVKFPSVGYRKYEPLGIRIEKKAIEDAKIAYTTILSLIQKENVVPMHFDGYYCPWDTMQKKRRWHNMHTVLIHGIDKQGKNWIADDPFYNVKDRKVPVSAMGTASKFYFFIDVSDYKASAADEIFQRALNKMLECCPIENMEHFLRDLKERKQAWDEGWLFNPKWVRMVENGYMTRHYLWIFFKNFHQETQNGFYGMLELLFFSDLQLWKECVIHSLKGARRKDKRERFVCFTETFATVIEKEKEICGLLKSGKTNDICELISAHEVSVVKDYESVNLVPFFNSRACRSNRRDKREADITGEGEYILPERKFLETVVINGIPFRVWLGESEDHLRCAGQEITVKSGQWKGIAFLVCSEWGCSQFLVKMSGRKKEYLSDCIINDFTNPSPYSVKIGKSYLKGSPKDYVFQKKIFLQYVYFEFPKDDVIKKIIMPQCPSAHVFSAVLLR